MFGFVVGEEVAPGERVGKDLRRRSIDTRVQQPAESLYLLDRLSSSLQAYRR